MEESSKPKKSYTPLQAKQKAESYCAYQERAQQEVRDKLYSWGIHQNDVENIIAQLIEDNFLNEERFAKAYALGKFRMKGWGKIKIKLHLKQKRVSEPLIRIALKSINEDDYLEKIREITEKRVKKELSTLNYTEKSKLFNHLLSKGYESSVIQDILNN